MTPLRLALTVLAVLAAGAMPLSAAEESLKSFTPDKPGLRFVPSTPGPVQPKSAKTYPPQYIQAVNEVFRAFRTRDWDRTRAALEKADQILPPTPMTLNTRGAIFIEEKNYEEGARLCEEALKLDPKFYAARFNLAEIPLVQGRYAESRKLFEKFIRENPKDELARSRMRGSRWAEPSAWVFSEPVRLPTPCLILPPASFASPLALSVSSLMFVVSCRLCRVWRQLRRKRRAEAYVPDAGPTRTTVVL